MRVYHGSTVIVDKPDISFSKDYLDFGKGFYVTSYKEQAENWAVRKAMRKNSKGIVNIYELDDDLSNLNVLKFSDDNIWLEFVCNCRNGSDEYKAYDIIIGDVADDKVFRVVEMYFKGIWDKKRTLEELKYYKRNNQICIVNQDALNKKLRYIESYEVVNND